MFGQQQLKFRMEELENKFSLGQKELKELILRTTAYMSGRLSVSERMKMEIDWLNENERHELLIKINVKNGISKGHTRSDDGVKISIMITKVIQIMQSVLY
ncbi:hypothetical protein [Bacillus sp. MRMR6]|uniref:hypothetical protein n=1 Tax=Bacillus sp. MRMR6 TaxID=1928617 RepID=UPI000952E384|nr:hypothetical protein [Bacillus sp. MRMR6]OLS40782.1 hypothetical protein BTR25_07790 [Bacillus sp. MRMR6]